MTCHWPLLRLRAGGHGRDGTDGGLVAVTPRNWEHLRAGRPGRDIADRMTYRNGRAGVVVRAWTVPDAWDVPHHVEIAVAVLDAGGGSPRSSGSC